MIQKYELLKSVFGHTQFRSFQEDAVDTILSQRDLMMILPTGGGKSLCYQLPSLMMPGVTVVISPLLALMHDQVMALKENGIKAEMLSSLQSQEEAELIRYELMQGELKLLYVSPERLNTPSFISLLKQMKINFFVIDEAHCVSEWGHEFRDDYRRLYLLREHFATVPIAAITATATPRVQADICFSLRLKDPRELRGKVFRNNLHISVERRHKDGKVQLLEFLKHFPTESGIVYAFSRKQTENLAQYLEQQGVRARAFHAGLEKAQKEETFRAFIHDEIQIVVATIAFGMGIDKSNIRFVVHMSLPKTIENYYQEIGRAGRDGLDSEVLLLFNGSDMMMQREFIDQLEASDYKENALNKLEQISRYASDEGCRHQQIAHYFEDELSACEDHCDNCTAPQQEKRDVSIEAQKLLSCVYRTGQRFGHSYVIDVLRGSKIQKVLDNGHETLSVYGIGQDSSRLYWERIMEKLMEMGALKRGEFRALVIDKIGMQILKGEQQVEINAERLDLKAKKNYVAHIHDEDLNMDAFEQLRSLRAQIAKEEGKPAYIVFGDRSLKEMANQLPLSKAEMLGISGVGEAKFEKYGQRFLEACKKIRT